MMGCSIAMASDGAFPYFVNSTACQIDPEERRDLVAIYHSAAIEAIIRFGRNVAKYLGDGVMAYFGWPEAAFAAPLSTNPASAAAVK